MLRHKLDRTLVCWVNTGAAYPTTIAQMEELKKTVPHFLEIKSNQAKQIETDGYPTDLVPLLSTPLGREVVPQSSNRFYKVQDSFRCCGANIWLPLHKAMQENGIKKVIRGQKNTDKY